MITNNVIYVLVVIFAIIAPIAYKINKKRERDEDARENRKAGTDDQGNG